MSAYWNSGDYVSVLINDYLNHYPAMYPTLFGKEWIAGSFQMDGTAAYDTFAPPNLLRLGIISSFSFSRRCRSIFRWTHHARRQANRYTARHAAWYTGRDSAG